MMCEYTPEEVSAQYRKMMIVHSCSMYVMNVGKARRRLLMLCPGNQCHFFVDLTRLNSF